MTLIEPHPYSVARTHAYGETPTTARTALLPTVGHDL